MRHIMESIKPSTPKRSTRFTDILNEHTMGKTYMEYARKINNGDATTMDLRGILDDLTNEPKLTHDEIAEFQANIYSIIDHRTRLEEYDISDVQQTPDLASIMEPSMDCINPECANDGDVVYDEQVNDAKCSSCGEWQEQYKLDEDEVAVYQFTLGEEVRVVNDNDDYFGNVGTIVKVSNDERAIVRFGRSRVSYNFDEIEPILSEEVDHTAPANRSDFEPYSLKSFDYQGRGNQKTRYVPARYADNPMQNASQFDEAMQPVPVDDDAIVDWLENYLVNATPDEMNEMASLLDSGSSDQEIRLAIDELSSHDLAQLYGSLNFTSNKPHISEEFFNLMQSDGWDITSNSISKRINNWAEPGTISSGARVVTFEFDDTYRYLSEVDGWGDVLNDWDTRDYHNAEDLKHAIDKYISTFVKGNTVDEATQSWMTTDIAHARPRVENTTSNGLRNSSLNIGDIIRSNNSMHGKVLDIDYPNNMISIQTANGTTMDISGNNAIDIITSVITETDDFDLSDFDMDTAEWDDINDWEVDDELLGESTDSEIDAWMRYYAALPENILLTNFELRNMAEVSVQNGEKIPLK